MTSLYSKISVFIRPHVDELQRFQKSPLQRAFLKRCVFGDRFHRMRVDGRPNRSRKISVFKQKQIRDVWKRRKRFPSFQRVCVDGRKRFEYAKCGSLFSINTEKKISVFKNMRISNIVFSSTVIVATSISLEILNTKSHNNQIYYTVSNLNFQPSSLKLTSTCTCNRTHQTQSCFSLESQFYCLLKFEIIRKWLFLI